LVPSLLGLIQTASSVSLQADLQYQKRGNRFEGIRPKPVSGYDVELISALVDFTEPAESTPQHFRLRFFLDRAREVHLTVRELDYKVYYWLDQVQPKEPWRLGFGNIFSWPTADVIQHLNPLRMYDLGAVARLGKTMPGRVESVAPLIFYHSQPPTTVEGYLFTFKTNGDARLTSSIYREGSNEALSTEIFRRQSGGRPFTVRWNSSRSERGQYRLVLKGYFLDNNNPLDQTVNFFHEPTVK
jgi:hypothetical protein